MFINAPSLPIRSIVWSFDQPGQVNSSAWTGTRIVVSNPWHATWSAKVQLAPIVGEANVRKLRSFLAQCRGSLNTFRLYATENAQNGNGGVTVAANAAAGARSMTISGAITPLLEGQFVTVNGQLLQLTADQSGSSISFEPMLRQQASAGTTVVTSRPYALVYMTSSSNGWSVDAGQVYGISFEVSEAVLEADGSVPEGTPAPVLTSPTAASSSPTAATIGVTTDEGNGTLFWTVDKFATTPSAAQVMAGQDYAGNPANAYGSQAVSSVGAQSATASGLSPSTTYYAHFAQENSLLGISLAISSSAVITQGVSAPTATATMAQISTNDANRIYQRSTTTGGGQGKGQGTVPLTISSATAGTLNARCRASDGSTILQAEWQAATIANGATTANISGVDARLGWFYLDIKDSTGTWQNGTTLIGMGALFAFAGQSLMSRMLGAVDTTNTYATSGIAPSQYGRVCASYDDNPATYRPAPVNAANYPWQVPQDGTVGTVPTSVGCGAFINDAVTLLGVNVGVVGHAKGGIWLYQMVSGQSEWTQFSAVISRIGGAFEGFFWGQGHADAITQCSPNGYKGQLAALYAQVQSINSFSGFKTYVWTVPSYLDSAWATNWQANRVRKGALDWCAANSATYVHFYDLQHDSELHQSNTVAGAAKLGRYMVRAMRSNYGASSGDGPQILSATRSGTVITATLSDVGQGALNLVGSPGNRIFVFPTGWVNNKSADNDNRFPVASVSSPNKTTLTITLANDPGDQAVLDLWAYFGPASDPRTDNIYDDQVTGSLSTGRILRPTFVPIQIAAANPAGTAANAPPAGYVNPSSTYNMTETSTTYAASATGFGQKMTGGSAKTSATLQTLPAYTAELFFDCPTLGATLVLAANFPNGDYIAINASGNLFTANGLTGATTLVAGKRYHVAQVHGPSGYALYLTNITDAGSGTRDAFSSTPMGTAWGNGTGAVCLRNLNGSFTFSGGAVDEFRYTYGEKYTGTSYSAPTGPFSATNDNDVVVLYHCDGDAKDAAGR